MFKQPWAAASRQELWVDRMATLPGVEWIRTDMCELQLKVKTSS